MIRASIVTWVYLANGIRVAHLRYFILVSYIRQYSESEKWWRILTQNYFSYLSLWSNCLDHLSENFCLAALVVHIFDECCRIKLLVSWAVSETVFLQLKEHSWYSLEKTAVFFLTTELMNLTKPLTCQFLKNRAHFTLWRKVILSANSQVVWRAVQTGYEGNMHPAGRRLPTLLYSAYQLGLDALFISFLLFYRLHFSWYCCRL